MRPPALRRASPWLGLAACLAVGLVAGATVYAALQFLPGWALVAAAGMVIAVAAWADGS